MKEENSSSNKSNLLYDETYTQTFQEKVELLKSIAEKFNLIYNSDLKIISFKRDNPSKLVEVRANADLVHSRIAAWKQVPKCSK